MARRARVAGPGRAGPRRVAGRRPLRARDFAGGRFLVAVRPEPDGPDRDADGPGFELLRFRGVATASE